MGCTQGDMAVRGSVLATVRSVSWNQECWTLQQWSGGDTRRRQEIDNHSPFAPEGVVQRALDFLAGFFFSFSYIYNELHRLS